MTILKAHIMNLQAREFETNFGSMILGVRSSSDLTHEEKEYITELLADQLACELAALEYTDGEPTDQR